jgi:hypothetical protein
LASSRIIGYVDKFPVVDLFPYKIKDVNKFIFRDHVPYNEDNPVSVDYAQDQWVKIIEGHWVFDFEEGKEEEGTWVYMMPNLYDYINFGTVTIRDETGQYDGPPECSDIEWIYGSYSLCFDGFSGFTDDPDYTCNLDILKLEQGKTLTPYEYERLDNQFVRKSDGTYKKYVEAWEYLTNYYLVENPRTFPLGKPLYFNGSFNGMVLASRKARKDLEENTLVYTEQGPVKIIDINEGDRIFGADGKLTTVQFKTVFTDQLQYKVTFKDGRNILCGGGHLWTVLNRKGDLHTMELNDIRKEYKTLRTNGQEEFHY